MRTTATAESEREPDVDVQKAEHSGKSVSAAEQADEEADAHAKEGLIFERRANFIVSTAKTVSVGVLFFLICTAGCETRPRHRPTTKHISNLR